MSAGPSGCSGADCKWGQHNQSIGYGSTKNTTEHMLYMSAVI